MRQQPNSVTGGDREADQYQAAVAGEEAVGGSASVPGQNDSDRLVAAAGISTAPEEALHLKQEMQARDEHRWELDPESKLSQS